MGIICANIGGLRWSGALRNQIRRQSLEACDEARQGAALLISHHSTEARCLNFDVFCKSQCARAAVRNACFKPILSMPGRRRVDVFLQASFSPL